MGKPPIFHLPRVFSCISCLGSRVLTQIGPVCDSPVMDGSLSLILPAYNEGAGIAEAVAEADDALAGFSTDYEIIVVDDGSRDDTAAAVETLAKSRRHV